MPSELELKTIHRMHSQLQSITRDRDVLFIEKERLLNEVALLRKAIHDIANGADVRETALKALAARC